MAAPPPRRPLHGVRQSHCPVLSPLEILLQLGILRTRAEKALAATGGRSVQLATDWLAVRLHDPKLDDTLQREYVLYMRPRGPLYSQICGFWEEVLGTVGRNSAQNLMPHITLCSYFKVSDEHSHRLSDVLLATVASVLERSPLPLPLPLEKYSSQNYMGLFVTSPAAPVLKLLRRSFMQAARNECPSLCPSNSSSVEEDLHLTLCYNYSAAQYPKLESLVQSVAVSASATWELCLYSRDPRHNGLELHRSLCRHEPQDEHELPLLDGEYVYLSAEDVAGSTDGWVLGTSWLTGCAGMVLLEALVRVPESDTWTMHRGLTINPDGKSIVQTDGSLPEEPLSVDHCDGNSTERPPPAGWVQDIGGLNDSFLNLLDKSDGSRRSTALHSEPCLSAEKLSLDCTLNSDLKRAVSPVKSDPSSYYSGNKNSSRSTPLYNFPIPGPRKLFVLRHGERADFTFGDWCKVCFNSDGKYSRADLNLQATIPARADAPSSYLKDSPLTRVGELQARLVGEGFIATRNPIHHVYCSPSLRCVMTATNVLVAMNIADRLPLKIEPGLFEWLAYYPDGMPRFLTQEEFTTAGYNIDVNYRPVISVGQLVQEENCDQYYTRSCHVTKSVLLDTKMQGGTVLLVAHAASLDTCLKQLTGGHPRTSSTMTSIVKKVAYCGVAAAEQGPVEGLWNLIEPPFRSPTHSVNHAYDWTIWRQ